MTLEAKELLPSGTSSWFESLVGKSSKAVVAAVGERWTAARRYGLGWLECVHFYNPHTRPSFEYPIGILQVPYKFVDLVYGYVMTAIIAKETSWKQ
jgi:hypothetical protein